MRYQVTDRHGKVVAASDQPGPVAKFLGVQEMSMRVQLSSGRGKYTRGRGEAVLTVVDHEYETGSLSRGRPAGEYVVIKYYPDADIGLSAPRAGEHEVTLDEVYVEAKRFYQPLTTSTVDVKLASPTGLKAALLDKSCTSYRKEPVHYTRVPKLRWQEHLEANPDEAERLSKNRQAYLRREGRLDEPTKKVVKAKNSCLQAW